MKHCSRVLRINLDMLFKISKRKMFLNMKEFHSSRHFFKNYVTKKFKKPRDKKDCWGMLKLNIEPSLNEQGNYYTHTHAHTYKHMQICIYTCKHIIPYTHVHIIHIHMYTYMFSYMYIHIKCYIEL